MLTLVAPPNAGAASINLRDVFASVGARGKESRKIDAGEMAVTDVILEAHSVASVHAALQGPMTGQGLDWCLQPLAERRKRLLIADMDSTIINVECIDELADFAGVRNKVSAITERAMLGELDFESALRERVAMLKDLPVAILQQAYDERVRLNPGARTLVRTMAHHGALCLLVSGGFTFFTERVAAAAGFAGHRGNTLGVVGDRLDGTVWGAILGREAKLASLQTATRQQSLLPEDTLAVGDGANDLAMIKAAGLGVAYRAKPIVAVQADAKIDHADLTALLYFQGYAASEFVTDW